LRDLIANPALYAATGAKSNERLCAGHKKPHNTIA
jgi:hypothetical protein